MPQIVDAHIGKSHFPPEPVPEQRERKAAFPEHGRGTAMNCRDCGAWSEELPVRHRTEEYGAACPRKSSGVPLIPFTAVLGNAGSGPGLSIVRTLVEFWSES